METPADNAIRFTVLNMLAMTSYIAFALAVATYTNRVAYGIHLSLGLVGYVLWRFAHGHLGGIIPALLGGDWLLCSSVIWVVHGEEDFMGIHRIMDGMASLLVLFGLGVLVWVGASKGRFWRNQRGVAASIFCTLVAWWIAIPMLGNASIARRQATDLAANSAAAAKAILVVEELRSRNGTAPNKGELQSLLTEPFPSVRWERHSQQIQYERTGATTYRLKYIDPTMFFGDIVIYDSATPQRGWYRIPF